MKLLSTKDLVVELIKTLADAEQGFNPGDGNGGVRLMPSLYWEGSYAELERCLDEMRDSAQWRQAWWHLTQRYLTGKVCTLDVSYRRTAKGPYPQIPGRTELLFVEAVLDSRLMRVRVYRWDERVAEDWVDQGLDRLLATMYGGDRQRIQLPIEFLYRALGKELPHEQVKQPRSSNVSSPSLAVA